MFTHRDDLTQSVHSGMHQRGSSGAHFRKQPWEPRKCGYIYIYIYELYLNIVKKWVFGPILSSISVDKLSFGYFRDKIEGNILEWGTIRSLEKEGADTGSELLE